MKIQHPDIQEKAHYPVLKSLALGTAVLALTSGCELIGQPVRTLGTPMPPPKVIKAKDTVANPQEQQSHYI